MPGPLFVDGDRISLHTVTDEDYEWIAERRNRPGIRRGIGQTDPMQVADVREMIEESEDSAAFVPCHAGQPVGYAWAFRIDDVSRRAYLGYWITESEQGQGYATATVGLLAKWAFRDRGLHKLGAHVFETNDASRKVLEANGFEREGVLRDEYWIDGEFVDAYSYGLLAEEWRDGDGTA